MLVPIFFSMLLLLYTFPDFEGVMYCDEKQVEQMSNQCHRLVAGKLHKWMVLKYFGNIKHHHHEHNPFLCH